MGGQSVIVLDTHALVWWVDDASKLSRKARHALRVHARRRELIVSAITVFEIVTLERRGRLQFKRPLREWLADLRKLPEIAVYPVTDVVAERAGGLGDPFPGDPADRLVAATALSLDVPLVSQDTKLRGVAALTTIW